MAKVQSTTMEQVTYFRKGILRAERRYLEVIVDGVLSFVASHRLHECVKLIRQQLHCTDPCGVGYTHICPHRVRALLKGTYPTLQEGVDQLNTGDVGVPQSSDSPQ